MATMKFELVEVAQTFELFEHFKIKFSRNFYQVSKILEIKKQTKIELFLKTEKRKNFLLSFTCLVFQSIESF